jgi:hypothetical protein
MVNPSKKKPYDLFEPQGQQRKVLLILLKGNTNGTAILKTLRIKKSGGISIQLGKLKKRGYIDKIWVPYTDSIKRNNHKPQFSLNINFLFGFVEKNCSFVKFNQQEQNLFKIILEENRLQIAKKAYEEKSAISGIVYHIAKKTLQKSKNEKEFRETLFKVEALLKETNLSSELTNLLIEITQSLRKYFGGTDGRYGRYNKFKIDSDFIDWHSFGLNLFGKSKLQRNKLR